MPWPERRPDRGPTRFPETSTLCFQTGDRGHSYGSASRICGFAQRFTGVNIAIRRPFAEALVSATEWLRMVDSGLLRMMGRDFPTLRSQEPFTNLPGTAPFFKAVFWFRMVVTDFQSRRLAAAL
jgi:hypothetical protein